MNLESYNYIIKSSSGKKTVIKGIEYTDLDIKESYITEYEAARAFFRLKPKAKNIKLFERVPNTKEWKEIKIELLLKKIKKNKTIKSKRALKGVVEEEC